MSERNADNELPIQLLCELDTVDCTSLEYVDAICFVELTLRFVEVPRNMFSSVLFDGELVTSFILVKVLFAFVLSSTLLVPAESTETCASCNRQPNQGEVKLQK